MQEADMKPNNRVQGTLHKVSGPLTRDVGPKTINDGITENYRRQRRHPIIRTKIRAADG